MKLEITVTFSKIVAVLVLFCAVYLDIENESLTAFMFAIPFVVLLITGKLYFDQDKT